MKRKINKKYISFIIVGLALIISTIGIKSIADQGWINLSEIINDTKNNVNTFLSNDYTYYYNKKLNVDSEEEIWEKELSCFGHWYKTWADEDAKVINNVIDLNIKEANTAIVNGNKYSGDDEYIFQALAKATSEGYNYDNFYNTAQDAAVGKLLWDLINAGHISGFEGISASYGSDSPERDWKDYYNECVQYGRNVVKNSTNGEVKVPDNFDKTAIESNVISNTAYLGPFQYAFKGQADKNAVFSEVNVTGEQGYSDNFTDLSNRLYVKTGTTFEKVENGSINPNTDFYISTNSNVDASSKIQVKINVKGASCYKGRVLLIRAKNGEGGQSLAAYSTGAGIQENSDQSLEYEFESYRGNIEIIKTGVRNGKDGNTVESMGYRLYKLDNNSKNKQYFKFETKNNNYTKTVNVTKQEETRNQTDATIFYTDNNGYLAVNGIDTRNQYYFEEVSDKSSYSKNIISAVQTLDGKDTNILNVTTDKNGNILTEIGPITVRKTSVNAKTVIKLLDDRKRGQLELEKVDEDTGKSLSGVTFKIKKKAGTGNWVVAELKEDGKYYVKQYSSVIDNKNYYQNSYTDDTNKATLFTTNDNGKITIVGLEKDLYYMYEVKNNNFGYNGSDIVEVTVSGTKIDSSKIKNNYFELDVPGNDEGTTKVSIIASNQKQTGNIEIVKKDKDTGKNLRDVSFKIQMLNPETNKYQYIIVSKKDYTAGEEWEPDLEVTGKEYQVGSMKLTDNSSEATTFKTDNDGVVSAIGVLVGKYKIEEISVGSNYGYTKYDDRQGIDKKYVEWVDPEGNTHSYDKDEIIINVARQSSKSNKTKVLIKNKMKYLIIKGIVWEDIHSGKGNEYSYCYDAENNRWNYKDLYCKEQDTLVEGITVRLKGTDKETRTDAEGKYEFKDVLIEDLDKYYVEFEYDGKTYTSVVTLVGDDSTINSKAGEVVDQRKSLNAAFAEITNKDGNINDRNHGYSRNSDGEKTGELTYINNPEKWYSTFDSTNYNTKLTANTNVNTNPDSKVSDYSLINEYKAGRYTVGDDNGIIIENVNLGLKRRAMPSTSIKNDLTSVKVQVNGYGAIYENDSLGNKYGQRLDYIEEDKNTGEYTTNLSAKFGEGIGLYTREIYPSDIQASSMENDNAKKLKVYATYTITIKNNSRDLAVSVPEIVNYYDSRYNIVENGTDFPTGKLDGVKMISLNGSDTNKILAHRNGTDVNGYKTEYITIGSIKDAPIIETEKSLVINVTYQVNDETVLKILSEGDQNLSNVTEVNGYSVRYSQDAEGCKKDDFYAGIDRLSAPGNATPGDTNTYENDTDIAPSFVLTAKGIRQIEGTVFEDTDANQKDNERKGNGKFDNGEKSIKGVTVKLLNKDGSDATYYPEAVSEDGQTPNRDVIKVPGYNDSINTGEDGHYVFRGVEPGEYLIKYTYANGTTEIYDTEGNKVEDVVQKYKSTIINSPIKEAFNNNDGHKTWYKENAETRNSDARDDYAQRQAIDEEMKTIEAITAPKITSLDAKTPYFEIPMEVEPIIVRAEEQNAFVHRIENIDFGIIERPRQQVKLEKTVDNIKVTLPGAEAPLFNGSPEELKENVLINKNADGVIDQIYVIMDNELIYGSHLELKYGLKLTNTSELDYSSEDYYYYGTVNNGLEPIKITGATIVDYLDKNLVLENGQNEWAILDMNNKGFSWTLSLEDEQNLLNKFSTIVKTEAISNGETLAPTDSKTISIMADKLLSENDQELVFENKSEVVKVEKTGGSFLYGEIPGNYAPRFIPEGDPHYVVPQEPDEADAPTTGIIPPTGLTNHNVLYAIIGITSLIALGAGTYGIRKFLKK